MDTYQFIAAMFSAGAWPVAAVSFAILLRSSLIPLLARTESAEGFGAKVVFGRELKVITEAVQGEVRTEIGKGPTGQNGLTTTPYLPVPNDPGMAPQADEQFLRLSDELSQTSSVGTIIAGWQTVEGALRHAAKTVGFEGDDMPPVAMIRRMQAAGMLKDETVGLIESLRDLRNQVTHGRLPPPPLAEARRYRETAGMLSGIIPLNIGEWQRRGLDQTS